MGQMHVVESRREGAVVTAERAAPPAGRRLTRSAEVPGAEARTWNQLLGEPALSGVELAALNALARPRYVQQGATIFSQHEPSRSLIFVREGDAALGWVTSDGQFRIERPVRGPGWLDQSSAWIDAAHAIDARAVTPLVVVELPREQIQALLVTHPQLARRLIAGLALEVHSLAVNTHGLMHKDAPARFAQWLLERCHTQPDDPLRGTVRLGERKRDIASQLAITPETLSRLMRSLTRQGVISVAGYTVHVTDVVRLKRVAEAD